MLPTLRDKLESAIAERAIAGYRAGKSRTELEKVRSTVKVAEAMFKAAESRYEKCTNDVAQAREALWPVGEQL